MSKRSSVRRKNVTSNHTQLCRGRGATSLALITGFAVALSSAVSLRAAAQCVGPDCRTEFTFEDKVLQKAPTHFKFQARISQAKLPVGEAVFDAIKVKLRSGSTQLCTEDFAGVRVEDSVLNLEIGRHMSCAQGVTMNDVIAAQSDVNLQVCIGGGENCLKPISVGAVPYAMKSSYAHQAQNATQANTAAQCNYAHRVTADRDLFVTKQVGDGYYDFHTPTALDALGLDQGSHRDGFIQWTPVDPTHNRLHLCGKDPNSDAIRRLSQFWIHADRTQIAGDAIVHSHAYAAQGLRAGFSPEQEAELGGAEQLIVAGDSRITGRMLVKGEVTAETNVLVGRDLHVANDANVSQDLGVGGSTRSGKLFVGSYPEDTSTVFDALSVYGSSHMHGSATVTGNAHVSGATLVGPWSAGEVAGPPATLGVLGDALVRGQSFVGEWSEGDMQARSEALAVRGDAWLQGAADVGALKVRGALAANGQAEFEKSVVFRDAVQFMSTVTLPGSASFGSVSTTGSASFGSVTSAGSGTFGSINSSGPGTFGSISSGAGTFTSVNSSGGGTFASVTSSGAGSFGSVNSSGTGTFGALSTSGSASVRSLSVTDSASFSTVNTSGALMCGGNSRVAGNEEIFGKLTVRTVPDCPPGADLAANAVNARTRLCVYDVVPANKEWHYASFECWNRLGARLCTYDQAWHGLGWNGGKADYWLADRIAADSALATKLSTGEDRIWHKVVNAMSQMKGAYCCLEFTNPGI